MMKKIIVLAAAFMISACGFTPMHAPTLDGGTPAFENISVEIGTRKKVGTIANSEGVFWVQQSIFNRIGKNEGTHNLTINPIFNRRSLGINAEDVATRYDMLVTMPYVLKDQKTGKVLDRGSVSATSTFGAPRDPYGRSVSEQAATQNISREVVDKLMIQLAAYYANAKK